jgi:hypothetical protein
MINTPTLDKLANKNIFFVSYEDEKASDFVFVDGCDNYYSVTLTAGEVKTLASELLAITATVNDPHDYDAGLLNDFGGGNVEWWQDYIRAEIARANAFWRSQINSANEGAE